MDLEAFLKRMDRLTTEDLQRNAVPAINRLLREAAEAPPEMCSFEEGCESCQ